ncbi:hypothetical protein OMP40_01125 [Cohnella rhizosphaerae]|uniref:Uncharacterized protein n=1 Tax=Cohnella rhizosphaerae TaxID=1457232 RepID=A0A9X4QRE4_9BACL|nr:hypothetical protein [Cohnella rhizosphaerae]MDG0808168.1 hypothetical protein [Cohnella rhizosphaerae]
MQADEKLGQARVEHGFVAGQARTEFPVERLYASSSFLINILETAVRPVVARQQPQHRRRQRVRARENTRHRRIEQAVVDDQFVLRRLRCGAIDVTGADWNDEKVAFFHVNPFVPDIMEAFALGDELNFHEIVNMNRQREPLALPGDRDRKFGLPKYFAFEHKRSRGHKRRLLSIRMRLPYSYHMPPLYKQPIPSCMLMKNEAERMAAS